MTVRIEIVGGTLAADFHDESTAARARVRRAVAMTGAQLQGDVKRRAKAPRGGPAGSEPRLQTGDYNRSINRRDVSTGNVFAASVGTDKPQARRLEFGFTGHDAAGREYNDRPRPHFGPALDAIAQPFQKAVADAIDPTKSDG